MQVQMQERRAPGRFNIIASIDYGTRDYEIEKRAASCDLSLKGAMLLMQESFSEDTQLCLVFHLPDSNVEFKVKANIVWQKRGGQSECHVGVTFSAISESDKYTLFNYIYNNRRAELMTHWWSGIR